MRVMPYADEIRRVVETAFEDLGAGPEELEDLNETILIDGRKSLGRSYRVDGLMAMWLVEIGLIQFYDEAGRMLRTINLASEMEPLSWAA